MKFKAVNLLLELSYFVVVCRHAGSQQFDSPMT
jgi:hypothetical protein